MYRVTRAPSRVSMSLDGERDHSRSPRKIGPLPLDQDNDLTSDQKLWLDKFGTIDLADWKLLCLNDECDWFFLGHVGCKLTSLQTRHEKLRMDRYFFWPKPHPTIWVPPETGAKILVVDRFWALMLVAGLKTCELRSKPIVKALQPGQRLLISTKSDPRPQILGSVVFSHCEKIEWDPTPNLSSGLPSVLDFESLRQQHRVEDKTFARSLATNRDGKLFAWFFVNPVKAPNPIEYEGTKGTVVFRFFSG